MASSKDGRGAKRASIGAKRNPASQQAILDAARAILDEEGLAGFSIEAVARRARAGKPTIYRWWPSRTALLLDVYQGFKNARPFPDTGSLAGDMRAFLTDQLFDFWRDRLCGTVFRSVIAEAQTDPDAARALSIYERDRRKSAERIVERAKARGEVSADFNGAIVIELLAGFAWHRLLTGRLADSEKDIEAVVALVMAAVENKNPGP